MSRDEGRWNQHVDTKAAPTGERWPGDKELIMVTPIGTTTIGDGEDPPKSIAGDLGRAAAAIRTGEVQIFRAGLTEWVPAADAALADLLDAVADLDEHTEAGLLHNLPKTIVEIATVVVTARDGLAAAILGPKS